MSVRRREERTDRDGARGARGDAHARNPPIRQGASQRHHDVLEIVYAVCETEDAVLPGHYDCQQRLREAILSVIQQPSKHTPDATS
jgi:hypothetical protein